MSKELKYYSVDTEDVETLTDEVLIEKLEKLLEDAYKLFPVGSRFCSVVNNYKTNTVKSHAIHKLTF